MTCTTALSYEAVLFDLDGVLTPTAALHARCWTRTFDDFLDEWGRSSGTIPDRFDAESDYLAYVDGKLRDDGVRDFLRARGIDAPEAGSENPPGEWTVQGIGMRKQALGGARAERRRDRGVPRLRPLVARPARRRDPDRSRLVEHERRCRAARGRDPRALRRDHRRTRGGAARLSGKPAPDGFLEAAKRLAVAPANAVVVEDALAGVAAGRAGFGLVIGVARSADPAELRAAGANRVVSDLAEMLQ